MACSLDAPKYSRDGGLRPCNSYVLGVLAPQRSKSDLTNQDLFTGSYPEQSSQVSVE